MRALEFNLSFGRIFKLLLGAGATRKESTVLRTAASAPFFQREADALATSITALSVPLGIVADMIAFLGISDCVD